MPDNTAERKRKQRLHALWPNESEDEPRCPSFGIEMQAGHWFDVIPDEPVFRPSAPSASLFHPLQGALRRTVHMHVWTTFEAGAAQLAQNLVELGNKLDPRFRAVIGGESTSVEGAGAKFDALVKAWRRDTLAVSDQTAILTHPSYYAIIGMGREALPFIFRDLERGGGAWFVALHAITQENPVTEQNVNDARGMREDWLAWGRAHGYVGS